MTCLATRFDLPTKDIQPHLRTASLLQYGKVQLLDDGDLMNASALVPCGNDRRDATFVRVSYIHEHYYYCLQFLSLTVRDAYRQECAVPETTGYT